MAYPSSGPIFIGEDVVRTVWQTAITVAGDAQRRVAEAVSQQIADKHARETQALLDRQNFERRQLGQTGHAYTAERHDVEFKQLQDRQRYERSALVDMGPALLQGIMGVPLNERRAIMPAAYVNIPPPAGHAGPLMQMQQPLIANPPKRNPSGSTNRSSQLGAGGAYAQNPSVSDHRGPASEEHSIGLPSQHKHDRRPDVPPSQGRLHPQSSGVSAVPRRETVHAETPTNGVHQSRQPSSSQYPHGHPQQPFAGSTLDDIQGNGADAAPRQSTGFPARGQFTEATFAPAQPGFAGVAAHLQKQRYPPVPYAPPPSAPPFHAQATSIPTQQRTSSSTTHSGVPTQQNKLSTTSNASGSSRQNRTLSVVVDSARGSRTSRDTQEAGRPNQAARGSREQVFRPSVTTIVPLSSVLGTASGSGMPSLVPAAAKPASVELSSAPRITVLSPTAPPGGRDNVPTGNNVNRSNQQVAAVSKVGGVQPRAQAVGVATKNSDDCTPVSDQKQPETSSGLPLSMLLEKQKLENLLRSRPRLKYYIQNSDLIKHELLKTLRDGTFTLDAFCQNLQSYFMSQQRSSSNAETLQQDLGLPGNSEAGPSRSVPPVSKRPKSAVLSPESDVLPSAPQTSNHQTSIPVPAHSKPSITPADVLIAFGMTPSPQKRKRRDSEDLELLERAGSSKRLATASAVLTSAGIKPHTAQVDIDRVTVPAVQVLDYRDKDMTGSTNAVVQDTVDRDNMDSGLASLAEDTSNDPTRLADVSQRLQLRITGDLQKRGDPADRSQNDATVLVTSSTAVEIPDEQSYNIGVNVAQHPAFGMAGTQQSRETTSLGAASVESVLRGRNKRLECYVEIPLRKRAQSSVSKRAHSTVSLPAFDDASVAALSVQHRLGIFKCSCSGCHAILDSLDRLIRHVLAVHGSESDANICPWKGCGRRCKTAQKMVAHVSAEHFTGSAYPCPYEDCEQTCGTARRLRHHIDRQHATHGSKLRRFAGPNQPRSSALPDLPDSVPPYAVLSTVVRPSNISEEYHVKLGPWVLRRILGEIPSAQVSPVRVRLSSRAGQSSPPPLSAPQSETTTALASERFAFLKPSGKRAPVCDDLVFSRFSPEEDGYDEVGQASISDLRGHDQIDMPPKSLPVGHGSDEASGDTEEVDATL